MHSRFEQYAIGIREKQVFSGFAALLLWVTFITSVPAAAQSDVTVKLGGLVQTEVNYAWLSGDAAPGDAERVGFTLRRTRLRANAAIGPKAGAFIHVDGDGGVFGVLDALAFLDATPRLRLRIGRMASAQPRAFILTPVVAMDANERAAIALRWAGATVGNKGRDYGLDVTYHTDLSTTIFFVHNGDGSFDRLRGNFQENLLGDVTGGTDRGLADMAYSVYSAFTPRSVPGLEIGGYVGYNGSRNPATAVAGSGRRYISYSGHAYLGPEPGSRSLRLKADVIGVQYDDVPAAPSQHSLGMSLFGALAVQPAAEIFARVESFDAYIDDDGSRDIYVTAGASYSISRLRGRPFSQERLTLAYGTRIPEEDNIPTNHAVVLQLQYNF